MPRAMPTLTNQTINLHKIFKALIGNTAFVASNLAHQADSTKHNAAKIIYLQG